MGVIVPEIQIFNCLEAIIKFIRFDWEERTDKTETLLYKICKGNAIERYDLYEQAQAIFITEEDNPRHLEVNMFFNMERAKIPTIHITLPSEQADKDGMGLDEGYQGHEEIAGIGEQEGVDVQSPIYTRRFNTQYQIVLTSDNSNEVVAMYHVLRAIMIPVMDSLNAAGLENIKLSGRDIQNMQTIVPEHVFIRSIGMYFEYEVSMASIFTEEIVKNILLSFTILQDPTSEQETANDLIQITRDCTPVVIYDSNGKEIITREAGEDYTVADSTVKNSDNTYSDVVEAEGTLILPDVVHTDTDGSSIILPAQTPLVCTIPTEVAFRRPPITGHTASYRDGDDYWNLINNPYPADPALIAAVQDMDVSVGAGYWNTLLYNNQHGNTTRFTDSLGGSPNGAVEGTFFDHLTGLEIVYGTLYTDWNSAIDYFHTLTLNGKSDYRVMNYEEIRSLWFTTGGFRGLAYTDQASATVNVGSSSTRYDLTTYALVAPYTTGGSNFLKSSPYIYVGCRTFA